MEKIKYISGLILVAALSITCSSAQTFLNGNFEKHTAPRGVDQINLPNADFNSKMANTNAFGTYGDVDIICTAAYNGLAQDGNWFIALTGGGTDVVALELNEPLVKGKTYTISFWDRACAGFIPQPFQIGVSEVNNDFGTPVYTAPMPELSGWTKRICTFVAPLEGKWITVQLNGANNIGDWAQCDNFLFEKQENTITTNKISGNAFCSCSRLTAWFSSTGKFSDDNIYTAQLSDKDGNFDVPLSIGTLDSKLNSGSIDCNLPCDIVGGSNYRIRIVSSEPKVTGTDNGKALEIFNSNDAPTLIISASPGTEIYAGTRVTIAAAVENGGTNKEYYWQVNGVEKGTNSSTYTSDEFQDGDVISLVMRSSTPCNPERRTVSNSLTIKIIEKVTPSVSIVALPGETIKKGQTVTFKAIPVNGGSRPVYQWQINGNNAGSNSSLFSSSSLKEGDVVTVMMKPGTGKELGEAVESNSIFITVNSDNISSVGKKQHLKVGSGNSFFLEISKYFRQRFSSHSKGFKAARNNKRKMLFCHKF